MKMKNFDLHMHSNYSKDGELTPKELIAIAKEKELEVIALSDHDCMLGIDEMIEEGKKKEFVLFLLSNFLRCLKMAVIVICLDIILIISRNISKLSEQFCRREWMKLFMFV